MMEYLLCQTHLQDFLTLADLSRLRQSCLAIRDQLDPSRGWVRKCRSFNPSVPWCVNGCKASCVRPIKDKWFVIYWEDYLPSIVPYRFWNCFLRAVKNFVSVPVFKHWWCRYDHKPLYIGEKPVWRISMRADIVGASTHQDHGFEELKDIDEFVSLGVSYERPIHARDAVLGLNQHSIGWHSDDGRIYHDSLVIGNGMCFGRGDRVAVILDYSRGVVLFEKNGRVVCAHELCGDFVCNPLSFGLVCKTMNSVFLSVA